MNENSVTVLAIVNNLVEALIACQWGLIRGLDFDDVVLKIHKAMLSANEAIGKLQEKRYREALINGIVRDN